MKSEFLKLMKCPYCGSNFKIVEIYEQKKGEIINGCVRCECNEFPLVDGILNLKIDYIKKYLIKLLKKRKTKEVLGILLFNNIYRTLFSFSLYFKRGYKGLLGKILLILLKAKAKHTYKKYSDKKLSFYDSLDRSLRSSYRDYLKHRFSAETFWSFYPFIPLLKQNRERILDLGCGVGHTSFVISNHVKPKQLVCADGEFSHLYLAKKYFAPNAEFICLDANYSLPFKDSIFNSILMLDSFHVVNSCNSLANDMRRTILPKGILLILHLPNSLQNNHATFNLLSTSRLINLFKLIPIKPLPKADMVKNFILKNKLDLTKKYSKTQLNSANAISIVGTKNKSLFKVYNKVNNELLTNKNHLIINPIYKIEDKKNDIILHRDFPSEAFRKEYPLTEKYLPKKYAIKGKLVKIIMGRTLNITSDNISEKDLRYIEYLMKKFIVINIPKNYF